MPGTFSPSPRVSDPDMHHGTCVTHVPWCMPGSLTSFLWNRRWGETFPAFPAHAQPRDFTYLARGPWCLFCSISIVILSVIPVTYIALMCGVGWRGMCVCVIRRRCTMVLHIYIYDIIHKPKQSNQNGLKHHMRLRNFNTDVNHFHKAKLPIIVVQQSTYVYVLYLIAFFYNKSYTIFEARCTYSNHPCCSSNS